MIKTTQKPLGMVCKYSQANKGTILSKYHTTYATLPWSNLKAPRCFKHGSFFCSEGSSAVLLWTTNPNPLFFLHTTTCYSNNSRVCTLFWTKNSRTFQGLSRTHFPFFRDSIQWIKEPWVYFFFGSSTTWVILSRRSFCVCSFFFGVLLNLLG